MMASKVHFIEVHTIYCTVNHISHTNLRPCNVQSWQNGTMLLFSCKNLVSTSNCGAPVLKLLMSTSNETCFSKLFIP